MLIAYPILGNAGYGISLIFISASFLSQTNAVFSASLKQTPPFLTINIGIFRRRYYRKKEEGKGKKGKGKNLALTLKIIGMGSGIGKGYFILFKLID
jgi:hypothetical protein